jgi:hypothetical protein
VRVWGLESSLEGKLCHAMIDSSCNIQNVIQEVVTSIHSLLSSVGQAHGVH